MIRKKNKSCIIIGGGISGLCTAYWLSKEGLDVTVIEKGDTPGGTIKTVRRNGFQIDLGPNSTLETTPLFSELFSELGLLNEIVYANETASNRYILKGKRLHPLPLTPLGFLRTSLWSIRGKLELLKEPFKGRVAKEESVADFVRRRLGSEFLDYAINPFVAGVYAGMPEELSVRSAFPKLYRLEEKYGGLVKGLIKGRRERKTRGEVSKQNARMFSFLQGMERFPRKLAESIEGNVFLNEQVIEVRRNKNLYEVTTDTKESRRKRYTAENIVIATPSYHAAMILKSINHKFAKILREIQYPPVALISLGYPLKSISQKLDGFGFLIPEKENRKILGTIWTSALFPYRAPADYASFTTFIGGARQPELTRNNSKVLVDITHNELKEILGIREMEPSFKFVKKWSRAIPQYKLGYSNTIDNINDFEEVNRGIHLCSNYRGGIAVGDCVVNANITAKRIIS